MNNATGQYREWTIDVWCGCGRVRQTRIQRGECRMGETDENRESSEMNAEWVRQMRIRWVRQTRIRRVRQMRIQHSEREIDDKSRCDWSRMRLWKKAVVVVRADAGMTAVARAEGKLIYECEEYLDSSNSGKWGKWSVIWTGYDLFQSLGGLAWSVISATSFADGFFGLRRGWGQ